MPFAADANGAPVPPPGLALLEPAADSDPGPITVGNAAGSPAEGGLALPSADRFLKEATREYQAGRIDQPLWMRAAAQSGGNEFVARDAYLRARATAMKLAQRQRRADPDSQGDVARATNIDADLPNRAIGGGNETTSARKHKYVATAVALVAIVAGASWWWGSGGSPNVVAAVPAPAVATASGAATASQAQASAEPEDHGKYFGGKIHELKAAGNWNVLVLYASEWSRKQPTNPTAWKELSIGYSNMRQFDDALQAATRATQLAPNDASLWRYLAQVNLSLDQPAAALDAFDKAVALDDRDALTLVQAGNVKTQLDRLPEARALFDQVLAANPDDIGALCGKVLLAQRSKQAKEADALARQIKALDGRCHDSGASASVAVAAGSVAAVGPATAKPSTPRPR